MTDASLRWEIHSYLGGISKPLNCSPVIVGGVPDHVHLPARFGPEVTQSEWVKELKRLSSRWIKERDEKYVWD